MKLIIITLAGILVLAIAANALMVGKDAPTFDLEDQFGKSWNLSNLRGIVIVVITANPDSGRLMGPWVDTLKTRYGSKIQILGLLDLHTVPAIGRWIAKSQIKKESKDPVVLDFNGNAARAYSVSGKYPVVTVIDKGGMIRAVQKGVFSKDGIHKIISAADKAMKKVPSQK